MTEFSYQCTIQAPIVVCFDLARSIDLHLDSTAESGEKAIAGTTSGLISLNEEVTWRAKHFGVWQNFTSKITSFESPHQFVDEMQKGAFKSFWHEHRFEEVPEGTIMTDTIRYEVPFGVFGKALDRLILKNYMIRLIEERNRIIKNVTESDNWKIYLATH